MRLSLLVLFLAGLAAVGPWIRGTAESETRAVPGASFPGWSASPLPAGAREISLSPREARFARQFPGKLGAFRIGDRTWIVRWVELPTRKLHPASDCLRGAGYTVKPTMAFLDAEGRIWSACLATRDHEHLRVRERIFTSDNREGWSDVSAWYWHAILGRSSGPWWAITVVETAESDGAP
jgi:hypothetical protein